LFKFGFLTVFIWGALKEIATAKTLKKFKECWFTDVTVKINKNTYKISWSDAPARKRLGNYNKTCTQQVD